MNALLGEKTAVVYGGGGALGGAIANLTCGSMVD